MISLEDYRFIILGDGHFNTLGMIRSLGEYGIKSDVVVVGGLNAMHELSRYVRSINYVSKPSEGVSYVIDNYADADRKAFLLTGNDRIISAIDSAYDRLKPYFYFFNAGEQGAINRLLSKSLQNELAIKAGFNVPDFEVVDVGELPSTVTYPIITKAVDSTVPFWKGEVYLCHNQQELLEAYKKIHSKKIILQHYVEKSNETGFNALAINQGRDVFLPLQLSYDSVDLTTFGTAIYFFNPTDDDLCDKVRRLLSLTGYSGIFSIDFLVDRDGKIWFLEVNFRNSAWSYPSTCAGVNLPIIWAKSILSGKLETDTVKIKKLPYTSIDEITALYQASTRGKADLLRAFWKVWRRDSHVTWNRRDPKIFLDYLLDHVKRLF